MGQSLVVNYVHIVFHTKYSQALIHEPVEEQLYGYITGICIKFECTPLIVGGYRNHVHILCRLSKKLALMTLVKHIKANSSRWMKTKDKSLEIFAWQNGYAAFSVNPRGVERVYNYIKNQHAHHQKKNLKRNTKNC